MPLDHLDLFSGIGGFALAAKWCGFNTVAFCEKDSFCKKVLNKNFPGLIIFNDIKEMNFSKKIDITTAGFPCQPFSQAGNKKGINDPRYLWKETFRIIKDVRSTWVILENVCGIVHMELENILFDLENEGYETGAFILPACSSNAPHRRDRVWIVAYNNSFRINNRIDNFKIRYIQENFKWYLEKIQSQWEQFKPDSWKTYKNRDWFEYNTRIMRENDGLSRQLDKDRIKSLGNSIVPQVIFPIMKLIYELEII